MIKLTFPIEPVPMARPRFAHRGRFTRAYIPAKQKRYMNDIKLLAKQQYHGKLLDNQPIEVHVDFYRSFPKSFSKRNKRLARDGHLWPITKPDNDNYAKLIIDACTGVIWQDDNKIVGLTSWKYYSEKPHIEMVVANPAGWQK